MVTKHDKTLQEYDREQLVRLDLDHANRLIGEETVAMGAANMARISPREVFMGALLNGAAGIIILHNHPGGDPAPCCENIELWRRLKEAGEILHVPLLDFMIIGDNGRYAQVDENTLEVRE